MALPATSVICLTLVFLTFIVFVDATYFKQLQSLRKRPVYYANYQPYRQLTAGNYSHMCSKTIVTYKPQWCFDQNLNRWFTKLKPVTETRQECCPGYEGSKCEKQCIDCDKFHSLTNRVKDIERRIDNLPNRTIIVGNNTGSQGQKGERGLQGPPGIPGPTGPKGDAGVAGQPGLSGPPGINGPPGARGKAGKRGEKGEKGAEGEDGFNGLPGIQGEAGQPGGRGQKGERGFVGIPGAPGLPGPTGEKGETGALPITIERFNILVDKVENLSPAVGGSKGERGPPGIQGVSGPPGLPGSQGQPGISGPPGPQGQKGDSGDTGLTGYPGEPGRDGKDGEAGSPGLAGLPGPQGPSGITGEPGRPGEPGIPGEPGARGEPGDVTTVEFPITVSQFQILVDRVTVLEEKFSKCCAATTTPPPTTTTPRTTIVCGTGEFMCSSGTRCIPRDFVCDGYGDCDDQSDEDANAGCKPEPTTCPEGLFRCEDGTCKTDPNDCDIEVGSGDDGSNVNRGDIPKPN